jgi:4-amino-4-deoxy-L-arabinose transferase-like glycosyltransferase
VDQAKKIAPTELRLTASIVAIDRPLLLASFSNLLPALNRRGNDCTLIELNRQKVFLRRHFDLFIFGLIALTFLLVATQRLDTAPVPDTDESYMLQTSYEMIYRGKLALPFRRYLGGNIENVWHSFTPLHYVMQSGFLKLFGWGLLQGRLFNLTMAMLVLVLVYGIGRRLFDWRAGLVGVGMLVCDVTFLERSRYLRNDFSASMFALLAFYLYETAERRESGKYYAASGLAAGAALMTHSTGLYMIAAITVLMLCRRGWRIIKAKSFYQFAAGAFAVSAYEIIYDLIDYKNVLLQNHDDRVHFTALSLQGISRNMRREARRYVAWYLGDEMYGNVSRRLLHLFVTLTVIAVVYLIIRAVVHLVRRNAMNEPRVRVLIVTVVAVLFFGLITGRKAIYYMAHLAPWFALAVGILARDGLELIKHLPEMKIKQWQVPRLARTIAMAGVVIAVLGFSTQAVRQTRQYLNAVRNPEASSFAEFKTTLRSLVPAGVCPVAVREPVLWLAFPEQDLCFANIQDRMKEAVDIDGNEYAMVVAPHQAEEWVAAIATTHHHLLGELFDTPYGSYQVYYTGTDPRWLALAPRRYQFFGKLRGVASEDQIAQAREVWSARPTELNVSAESVEATVEAERLIIRRARGNSIIDLCAVDLKPHTIYRLHLDTAPPSAAWAVVVIEDQTEQRLYEKKISQIEPNEALTGVFRTGARNRVRIGVLPVGKGTPDALTLARISLHEVAPVD